MIARVMKAAVTVVVFSYMLLFILQNHQIVSVTLSPFLFQVSVPLFVLIITGMVLGGGLVMLFYLPEKIRHAFEISRLKKRTMALNNEIQMLKIKGGIDITGQMPQNSVVSLMKDKIFS